MNDELDTYEMEIALRPSCYSEVLFDSDYESTVDEYDNLYAVPA